MSATPVLDLLRDESHWTQGALTRDEMGRSLVLGDSGGVSWCLIGAVMYCYTGARFTDAMCRLVAAAKGSGMETDRLSLTAFNDSKATRHPMVVELLEKAQI